MSDFAGMEELLQDFLTESSELLADVDNKLVELEKRPGDTNLLNDIFRGFHTIKGGAGFLNVASLVSLCHRTENLFDKLRNNELQLSVQLMDVIMDATGTVRDMFDYLAQRRMPPSADSNLLDRLEGALRGEAAAPSPVAAPLHQHRLRPRQVAAQTGNSYIKLWLSLQRQYQRSPVRQSLPHRLQHLRPLPHQPPKVN